LELTIEELVGRVVVLDVTARYVYLGMLSGLDRHYLDLRDADVHDLRDTATSRETYLVNSRLHGVHANRRSTWVRLAEVVCLSRLDDVLTQ
jgi:hypothetical protein